MKYNWDRNVLLEIKMKYEFLLKSNKKMNKSDKNSINSCIDTINTMLGIPNKRFVILQYADKNKYLFKSILFDYMGIDKEIRKIILRMIPLFRNKIADFREIPQKAISNSDLIAMSHDFFHWLPNSKYYELAKFYLDPNNHLLRILKGKSDCRQILSDITGSTYVFYYPRYIPFFELIRSNTIFDFVTLNHEIGHGIYYSTDSDSSFINNHYYLSELEGEYFDYLSIEFLKEKKIINDNEASLLYYTNLLTKINIIFNFFLFHFTVQELKLHKNIYFENVIKSIMEQEIIFPLDESMFKQELNESPKIHTKYIISFLAGLDLATIDQYDREHAFYLFEQIRLNKTNDIIENLKQNEIHFMEDGYTNLRNTLKKL